MVVWIGLIRDSWGTHTHMLNVWHIYHKFRLNVGNYAIHWASGISKNLFLIWGSLQISKPQAANSFGVPNSIAFDEVFKESLKVDVRFVDVFFLWMFCWFWIRFQSQSCWGMLTPTMSWSCEWLSDGVESKVEPENKGFHASHGNQLRNKQV